MMDAHRVVCSDGSVDEAGQRLACKLLPAFVEAIVLLPEFKDVMLHFDK